MEMKRVWDNQQIIGEVRKSDNLKLVVAAVTRDGFRCISIREFYKTKRDESWHPGRDGLQIPLVVPINQGESTVEPFEEFYKVLAKAAECASTMALLDEANAVWAPVKEKK